MARPIATPSGFTQPEAVRYDPDRDVYFVSNFGPGDAEAKDNNRFISRMTQGANSEMSVLYPSCRFHNQGRG